MWNGRARVAPFALAVISVAACAQQQKTSVRSLPETPSPVISGDQVPPGTKLFVQLEQPIDKTTLPGQRYTAMVAQEVLDTSGEPLIPVGSEVMGRVVNVTAAKGKQPALVDLNVDSLIVRGVMHPITGRIPPTTLLIENAPRLPAGTVLNVEIQSPISVAALRQPRTAQRPKTRTP